MSSRSSSLLKLGRSSRSSEVSRGCTTCFAGWEAGRGAVSGATMRARPTPVTRSIRLGTRPFGFGAGSLTVGAGGTAGWVNGTGRVSPVSTGFGTMNEPPRIAAFSAASAACGSGSLSCSARNGSLRSASRAPSIGDCAAFWASRGWAYAPALASRKAAGDVGVGVDLLADAIRRLIDLKQRHVQAPGDVD